MQLFQIKHRINGSILFELECGSLKLAVEGAVESGAYLGGANLGDANLGGANLGDADLRGANLRDIKVSWSSHFLLSEILWRVAKTQSQHMLAAFVGRKTDWCWDDWVRFRHKDKKWAIGVLAKLARADDSNVPGMVRSAMKA